MISISYAARKDQVRQTARTRTCARSNLCAGACVCRNVPALPLPARRIARRKSSGFGAPCAGRHPTWPGRCASFDFSSIFHRHGWARSRGRIRRIRGRSHCQPPRQPITYILGSVILGWTGKAQRAIEWAERGMRLSPFDPLAFVAYRALSLGHFHQGRYEEALNAAHKAVQSNPAHSISYMLLAAILAKLGRFARAQAAAAGCDSTRCGVSFVGGDLGGQS